MLTEKANFAYLCSYRGTFTWIFDYVYSVHSSAKSARKMGGGHLQCKVMDAFFSVLLQIFVNTERYILSVEVLHWSSHQLMTSTSAGIKFLMLLVRKYLVLVDVFCITLFVCIWLLVELQYSGNKHVTFMMLLDLSFCVQWFWKVEPW